MYLHEAQQEVRRVFYGGAIGQLVTGIIWLVSAVLGTFSTESAGALSLFFGGMFIFPLTQLILRLLGKPSALDKKNPLGNFPIQTVIAMFATYPLIYMAISKNMHWFYPAFMLAVGGHYVMFILLYGMRQYGFLAGALILGGLALFFFPVDFFALGGWITAVILIAFAVFIFVTRPWVPAQAK